MRHLTCGLAFVSTTRLLACAAGAAAPAPPRPPAPPATLAVPVARPTFRRLGAAGTNSCTIVRAGARASDVTGVGAGGASAAAGGSADTCEVWDGTTTAARAGGDALSIETGLSVPADARGTGVTCSGR